METLFRFEEIHGHVTGVRRQGFSRVVLADLGKNIYPYYRAARQCDIEILAVADDRFAAPGRAYREVPIVPVERALALGADAVIVSNTSVVHAGITAGRIRLITGKPVYDWYGTSKPETANQHPILNSEF